MENQNKKWVFVPINKQRIIKELDKAILINLGGASTILPKVFKRAKESDTLIYFSLPADFKINVRTSWYNQETRRYEEDDKLFTLETFVGYFPLKDLSKSIPTDVVEEERTELPFED